MGKWLWSNWGADTGLFGCCSITCCMTRICCLAPIIVLWVMAWPSLSCSWLKIVPNDFSISSISGEVEAELLVGVVPVLGLIVVDEASLLLDVPLELSEELSLEDWVSVSVSWLFRDGLAWAQLRCGRRRSTGGRCYGLCFCLLVWNALCGNLL